MPAQVELVVLLAVLAGGIAYVWMRVRRGALDEERAGERRRAQARGRSGDDARPPEEPDHGGHDADA